ncbi:hypothetical protein UCRPC4_g00886 [Phaeomoniella chlamydospora]|uniref:Uncharacterized protein n=1 Tax=Phaeomoniella chlamydospora TaxID=158046 RepID=A0A0G2GWR3_PHACM|nr:hypothetical protein UCRPC4_g00886 [Phaeomoniella chlamydospora]
MPSNQTGYLFVWMGISNGTGDLIQSVLGSYPEGQSECGGQEYADTTWCVSSEVYGNDASGNPNQWVETLTTADINYANGIIFNYTLVDKENYTWNQTMTDAVTGSLLSTFSKNSGPMLGWGTALECNDYNGVACTGTIAEQTYVNSTIILEAADSAFSSAIGASSGATYTDMETADGGKTWTIAKIVIPAMESDAAEDNVSTSSVVSAASSSATLVAAFAATNLTSGTSSAVSSAVSTLSTSVSTFNTTSSAFSMGTAPLGFHHHYLGDHDTKATKGIPGPQLHSYIGAAPRYLKELIKTPSEYEYRGTTTAKVSSPISFDLTALESKSFPLITSIETPLRNPVVKEEATIHIAHANSANWLPVQLADYRDVVLARNAIGDILLCGMYPMCGMEIQAEEEKGGGPH